MSQPEGPPVGRTAGSAEPQCPAPPGTSPARPPVLSDAEATRRLYLLAELQAALDPAGVRCVLARHHRLVLRYHRSACEPSGLTDPALHIFTPGGSDVATTDGTTYRLASDPECAVSDPDAVVAAIVGSYRTTTRT